MPRGPLAARSKHRDQPKNMFSTSTFTIGTVALAASAAAGVLIEATFATRYSTERTFEVSVAVESANETLSSEMYIDGEPMEGRGFGGGGSSTSMSYSYTDTAKEVKDGVPTKVERSFDEVSASTEREGRDGPMEMEAESSFDGLTILISGEDDESEVEIVDGEEPEGEGRLEGHRLSLPLDTLLPEEAIEPGATWDIEGEALMIALGAPLEGKLIDRPQRGGEGGGEGRGGRGGMRGGSPRTGLGAIAGGEWSITATLTEETEEAGGLECAVISLEIEVEGAMEARQRGGRGGRGGQLLPPSAPAPQESTYTGEFEGALLWSIEEERPVALRFEGSYQVDMEMERETQRGLMEMSRSTETTLEINVDVATGKAESDD